MTYITLINVPAFGIIISETSFLVTSFKGEKVIILEILCIKSSFFGKYLSCPGTFRSFPKYAAYSILLDRFITLNGLESPFCRLLLLRLVCLSVFTAFSVFSSTPDCYSSESDYVSAQFLIIFCSTFSIASLSPGRISETIPSCSD